MRAYVLFRDMEQIFQYIDHGDKMRFLEDTQHILTILFASEFDAEVPDRFKTIPGVAMWEGNEAALLMYYQFQLDDVRQAGMLRNDLLMLRVAEMHQGIHDQYNKVLWGEEPGTQGSGISVEVHNPVLTASDELIWSHRAVLIATNPVVYGEVWPEIQDLSVDYVTHWTDQNG